jgi:thiol-disulfide isomerase/thioredoxin
MKHFLLLFSFFLFSFGLTAQLASGTKLSGNIKTKDVNGKDVDIFADLAAGKSVVIDVFATWCGPCWGFHQTHMLEELYEEFGPKGTDQIRVYAIEGDNSTPVTHLYNQVAGTSSVPSSIGNWVEGTTYPFINSGSFNSLLSVTAFPTLYVIRPDKTVMSMFGYHYNKAIWEKALLPTNEKELVLIEGLSDRTFCVSTVFNQRPKFLNLGSKSIDVIDISLKINGQETISSFTKNAGVFQEIELSLGSKTFRESTEVEVIIDDIDNSTFDVSTVGLETLSAKFQRNVTKDDELIVKFTTDFYPVETKFILRDGTKSLINHTFSGNADGGGEDANKTFEFPVSIDPNTSGCLSLTISDSFGDGLTAFNDSHPVPGVEIYDSAGNLIKDKLVSDFDFTSSRIIATVADFTSSLEDAEFVENLSVFPNPATDILNVNMIIKDGVEYQIYVSDIMGARVSDIARNTNFINVADLAAGMYFINVQTKDGLYTHKFSKI